MHESARGDTHTEIERERRDPTLLDRLKLIFSMFPKEHPRVQDKADW